MSAPPWLALAEREQARDRAHEAACRAMREATTPEERAAARAEALRLEAVMLDGNDSDEVTS